MFKYIKNIIVLIGALTIITLSYQLPTWPERLVLGGGALIIFIISVVVITERLRRRLEGYYVYMSGGSEDGDLVYREGSGSVRLYFKRRSHTIYVPTDGKWLEVMPDWAKQNKNSIMERVKSQIGKHWSFEATEERERILTQE